MRLGVPAVAVALAAVVFLGLLPGRASAANYWSTCTASRNACMVVENSFQGSDHVIAISVWTLHTSAPTCHTYRVLFAGTPRYASYTCTLSAYFAIGYNVDRGKCVQGGVEGLADARTRCWYAP